MGGKVEDDKLQTTVQGMIERAGLGHKKQLDFEDFLKMFGNDIKNLSKAKLNFKGVKSMDRSSYLEEARDTIENIYEYVQFMFFICFYLNLSNLGVVKKFKNVSKEKLATKKEIPAKSLMTVRQNPSKLTI